MNATRFSQCARLAAAADANDQERIAACAAQLASDHDSEIVREVFRFMHLFRGFPAMVRALDAAKDCLQQAPENESLKTPEEVAVNHQNGLDFFEQLYGEDAAHVLPYLHELDPQLSAWVLDYAYGRVMCRELLPLEERERLAVLLLAAGECWSQWESHVRICLRLDVPISTLRADALDHGWPHNCSTLATTKLGTIDES